jgi:hypothetical protein
MLVDRLTETVCDVTDLRGLQEVMSDLNRIHEPPPGAIPFTESETAMWAWLMKSRAFKDWSPTDILLAARVVRYETVIRRGYIRIEQLMCHGADPLDPDSIASEYAENLRKYERQQMTHLRALGFTRSQIIKRETTTTQKREVAMNAANESIDDVANRMGGEPASFMALS